MFFKKSEKRSKGFERPGNPVYKIYGPVERKDVEVASLKIGLDTLAHPLRKRCRPKKWPHKVKPHKCSKINIKGIQKEALLLFEY